MHTKKKKNPLTKFNTIHDKNSQQTKESRKFPNLIKGIYEKLTVKIIVNGDIFLLSLGTKLGLPLLPLLAILY